MTTVFFAVRSLAPLAVGLALCTGPRAVNAQTLPGAKVWHDEHPALEAWLVATKDVVIRFEANQVCVDRRSLRGRLGPAKLREGGDHVQAVQARQRPIWRHSPC